MKLLDIDTYTRHIRLLGAVAVIIAILTWAIDLANLVYSCPYCRSQRTVIGLLGLIMMVPRQHWSLRYVGAVCGVYGLSVASHQHFKYGWMKIAEGEFAFRIPWYTDSFLLSGAALFIITAQVLLLFLSHKSP